MEDREDIMEESDDRDKISDSELKRSGVWDALIELAKRVGYTRGFKKGFKESLEKQAPESQEGIRKRTIIDLFNDKKYSIEEIADMTDSDEEFVMKIIEEM